ncbi:transcription initiation factor TFIID subunit 13 isoform X1 [Vulpes lagopus]|uniref:transcription initiation factor TFIID subunit 13 isoform X1 n=1 Tax=Vulpes lagopus TaxID=494514 RepID=UPI001BC9F407|nr:transcription initiation factor TFIID subunit 13 isoform X1 [Vulpes lagopus]
MADEEEDPAFEEENEEIGGGAEGGQGKRKRLFSKELRCMMYGFGDDQNPYTESVDILEDLVIEFITEMVGLNPSCSEMFLMFIITTLFSRVSFGRAHSWRWAFMRTRLLQVCITLLALLHGYTH